MNDYKPEISGYSSFDLTYVTLDGETVFVTAVAREADMFRAELTARLRMGQGENNMNEGDKEKIAVQVMRGWSQSEMEEHMGKEGAVAFARKHNREREVEDAK